MYTYKTQGTCSQRIELEIENDIVKSCRFAKGCSGNLQGISRLARGRSVDELIDTLRGIQCQNGTSCPDQLARALEAYKAKQAKGAQRVVTGRDSSVQSAGQP